MIDTIKHNNKNSEYLKGVMYHGLANRKNRYT